ncbi:MAG TPA: hypothetical protein VFP68_09340 [Burkholderiaceae bacterium]|nr:hypothetical protein [Burkholderiaceae bacterium]
MLAPKTARLAILVVIALSVVAAYFRVSTAPERMKAHRDTARTVCESTGGQWSLLGRDEVCVKAPRRP